MGRAGFPPVCGPWFPLSSSPGKAQFPKQRPPSEMPPACPFTVYNDHEDLLLGYP